MFVVCLFRALYQGTDKTLDFTKSMVRMQKLLGCIDKLRTLVEGEWAGGGCSSKRVSKPMFGYVESLVLPDIIANKALGESALPRNFFSILMHPTHLSRPLALMI